MLNFLKKKWLYVLFSTLVIIVVITLFVLNRESHSKNSLLFESSENGLIFINNSLPMTDEVGKKIDALSHDMEAVSYLEFEVNSLVNNKLKYEIILEVDDENSTIPIEYVKLYLTDENDKPIDAYDCVGLPTIRNLEKNVYESDNFVLYRGTLKDKTSHKFRLRVWVADTYELSADEKEFRGKLSLNTK